MTLTEEQIQSNLKAYEHAMRTGSTDGIQIFRHDTWGSMSGHPLYVNGIFRICPTPKLRPWKPEEVPLGAWIKYKTTPEWRSIITYVSEKGIGVASFDDALHELVHSTDGGKTWLPCGVMEDGE